MLLRNFYDEGLAQASYLIGCVRTGEAMVIDPARDIEPYLESARREGLRITHVTETHIHADFVSGSRELGVRSGATIYLSDAGPAEWKYSYAHEPNVVLVNDGDAWMVGNIRVEVMATPGHTPEHISFAITDTANADEPIGIFTGDFVFVGDVGRPDLLEAAAGMAGTKVPGARKQFDSVQRLKRMPDYLQIWPGHGAGSACGKALGAIPSSTLGYEKRFNPAFQFENQEAFVEWLLAGQPEPPRYFARMKHVNKVGPAPLLSLTAPAHADRASLHAALKRGEQVVDLRPATDFARGHIADTLSVPATAANYSTYIGWFARYDQNTHLILPSLESSAVKQTLSVLRAIGIDQVASIAGPEVLSSPLETLPSVRAREAARDVATGTLLLLDVRGEAEYREAHIESAQHIPLGFLPGCLSEIPRERAVAVHCASGYRSIIATSLLRSLGFSNVINIQDDFAALEAVLRVETGLPTPVLAWASHQKFRRQGALARHLAWSDASDGID